MFHLVILGVMGLILLGDAIINEDSDNQQQPVAQEQPVTPQEMTPPQVQTPSPQAHPSPTRQQNR